MAVTQRLRLGVPANFDLQLALFGHGWIALAPHTWDPDRGIWSTAMQAGQAVVDVQVRQSPNTLTAKVTSRRLLARPTRERLRRTLRHCLRLDESLGEFWALCRSDPERAWVARRAAGRLLRSPSVFEDLVKLLLTTNCTWSNTVSMNRNLVEQLGPVTPLGHRSFPSPARIAELSVDQIKRRVRAGYRARHLRTIAQSFHCGELRDSTFLDPGASTDAIRSRLLALPGIGPYAAGQALRLLGRYDDLALDSWCRAKYALQRGLARAPADSKIEQEYAPFGHWAGLAFWMDHTRDWHDGQGPDL